MKKLLLMSPLFMLGISCASVYKPDVWDDVADKNVHTLRLYTGSKGECLYNSNFEEKAQDVCKGKEYEVLEKTRAPKTLHPKLYDEGYFTWVVRCK